MGLQMTIPDNEADIVKTMKAYKTEYLAAELGIGIRRIRRIISGRTRMYFDEGVAILKLLGGNDE